MLKAAVHVNHRVDFGNGGRLVLHDFIFRLNYSTNQSFKVHGVVFARKLSTSLELDIDFDGTAADFAQLLEVSAIKILELGASYVKI